MSNLRFTLFFATFAALATASGCTITTNDTADTGKLVARWTIAGTADPAQCTYGGAVLAHIDVLDANGTKRNTDDSATCSSFGASFSEDFPAGAYTVQTTLLGQDGKAVTTTASVGVVVPGDGTTAITTTDFPTSSFLTTPVGGTGKLEVDWTIDESADGSLCASHNAVNAHVDVLDATSTKVNAGSDTQTCSALATSFTQSFPAGSYTVQVSLVAADGTARTTTATAPVTVPSDGTTVKVGVDFPETSFLAAP